MMDLPPLPRRDPSGHKGTFGTVSVVGGCASTRPGAMRMIGAPMLAARGALRAGAGLVRVVMPEPILSAAVASLPPVTGASLPVDERGEILGHEAAAELDRQLASAACVVIGPGLGTLPEALDPSRQFGEGATSMVLRAVQQEDVPVVLDADGLNLLSKVPEFWRDLRARIVMTPHPGEFRRLAAALNIDLDPIDPRTRPQAAEQLAQRLGAIMVLKGAGTVVSDGHRTWVCTRGHSCMGTGGTGDVLAGVIGALIAQHAASGAEASHAAMIAAVPEKYRKAMAALEAQVSQQRTSGGSGGEGGKAGAATHAPERLDVFDAARLAVQIHAVAGERWAAEHGESGLVATELADEVPAVMQGMREAGKSP